MKTALDKILTVSPWVIFTSMILIAILSETYIGVSFMFAWFGLLTYWTIRVGEELHSRLEDKSILSIKRFKFQIAFVVIYILTTIPFGGYEVTTENYMEYGWLVWIIIPFHLIFMFFIFHTIYFLSKCITTLRNKQEVVLLYMIGFWVFPIGIWIIQPRIIELIKIKPAYNNG